jgi:hypothetical protein
VQLRFGLRERLPYLETIVRKRGVAIAGSAIGVS